jgi:hypothetical protein
MLENLLLKSGNPKSYRKLTKPLAKSKKAGVQSKIAGKTKNIDNIKKRDAIKSTTLKTSPLKTNKPLISKRPAQNNKNLVKTSIPNISNKKAIAAARSIPPNTLSNMSKTPSYTK